MLNFLLARLLPLIQILRLFLLRFCFNFDSCFDSNRIPAAFYFLASVPVTYYVFVLTLSYTNPTSVSASNCFYSFHVSFPKLLMFLLLNVFQFLFCSYILLLLKLVISCSCPLFLVMFLFLVLTYKDEKDSLQCLPLQHAGTDKETRATRVFKLDTC